MSLDCCCNDLWAIPAQSENGGLFRKVDALRQAVWRSQPDFSEIGLRARYSSASGDVYVSSQPTGSARVYRLRAADGLAVWNSNPYSQIYGIDTDSGGIYLVFGPVTSGLVKLSHTDGSELWESDISGVTGNAVVSDGAGAVYVTGPPSGGNSTRKYDASDGSLLWSAAAGGTSTAAIVLAQSGGVLVGRTDGIIAGFDADGASTGQYADFGGEILDMDIDGDGNLAVVGEISAELAIRVYDSGGSLSWSGSHGASASGSLEFGSCRFGSSGSLYVCGEYNAADDASFRLFNSAGVEQWAEPLPGTLDAARDASEIDVDPSGNIYLAHRKIVGA